MKFWKLFSCVTASTCAVLPLSACSKTPFFAVSKNSLYVGDTFTENDILVMENGKAIPYDSTGQNGFKVDDNKYKIGYLFVEDDIGQHKINVVYKTNIISVTINVTEPKVVTPKFPISPYTQRFFKTPKVANKIYVVNVPDTEPYSSYKNQWYVLLESLEGILAQTEARIFVPHDVSQRNTWFAEAKKEMGFETEEITPIQALQLFKDSVTNQKFVVYSGSDNSLNYATTISGAEKYLICDNGENFVNQIKELGFTQGADATTFTSQSIFDQYKDKLNTQMLINQKASNIWLRDYAIASKSFTIYLDNETEDFKKTVLNWASVGAPVLGWANGELETVKLLSEHNKNIIPADNCANLSLYSGYAPKQNSYQVHKDKITPESGKHYVAIVMSDGDNAQWLQNDWWSTDWFGNGNRGTFPMNWTLNPSILDINPQIIDRINTNRTSNDYFVCSGSGYGYANYSKIPAENRRQFAISSAEYMKNNDMSVGYFLDPEDKSKQNFNELFEQAQISGGVLAYGDKYAAGKGGVSWINNKPLISCRETLWDDGVRAKECFEPSTMANRINNYTTNPTEISGYTVVNCHSWSYGKMDDVAKMVCNLASHVQVVTCEQLINMVAENVPHEDVEQANAYPWYYD